VLDWLWAPGILFIVGGLAAIWRLRLATDQAIYVSGFGATGMNSALAFNTALAGIGLGGFLIALAARALPASPALAAGFFASLTGASLSFVAASRITCSLGCPIPFTPGAAWQDAVHVALACLGFGLALLAMFLSIRFGRPFSRLVPPVLAGVALPAATGGILSLLSLAPALGGWLELAATTVALGWLVLFATLLGARQLRARLDQAAAPVAAEQHETPSQR
ncbi:hypothetical protein, partial [Leucobacter sp. M11]|uniref:hypothetical protein n=1 Tax=Leucobacter sp. M11 TaxID=2993565 RepID=UPI002D80DC3C